MDTLIVANEVESRHRRDDRVKCDDERRKAEELHVKQEDWRAQMLDYLRRIEALITVSLAYDVTIKLRWIEVGLC